ncbi:MAG: FAD-dependent oxidoreductase, partial [Gammaproteobacteria bacterium]|nr:FAD-dependent oxidoreductase [Gammaproteobacteria bacterium]
DGRILAGSTLEHTGFEKQTTDDALHSLKQSAIELVPALAEFPIEHHWAGLRPGTQQGIPYICQHPEIKGLYINSGHYRNGVILGAASAKLMSDLLTGKQPELDLTPYQFEQQH